MAASGDPTSYYVVSFISTIMLFVLINANFAVGRELNRLPERGHLWIIHALDVEGLEGKKSTKWLQRGSEEKWYKRKHGRENVSKLETLNLSFLQSFYDKRCQLANKTK